MTLSQEDTANYVIATDVYVAMHFLTFFDSQRKKFPRQSLEKLWMDFIRQLPPRRNRVFDTGMFVVFLRFACINFARRIHNDKQLVSTIPAFNNICVSTIDNDYSLKNIIRHMRNALSHNRYEISPNYIVLRDRKNTDSPDNFELKATNMQLLEVIRELFKRYVLYHNRKAKAE